MELLSSDELAPDKFWALKKRIDEDRHRKGVRLTLRKSSEMLDDLIALYYIMRAPLPGMEYVRQAAQVQSLKVSRLKGRDRLVAGPKEFKKNYTLHWRLQCLIRTNISAIWVKKETFTGSCLMAGMAILKSPREL